MKFVVALYVAYFAIGAASAAATAMATTAEKGMVFPGVKRRLQEQGAHKDAVLSQEELPTEESASVSVPPPENIGPDGFPVLPQVNVMLGGASETLKSVNSQASVLEARVTQAQMASEAKMGKQKAAFEQKLKEQEAVNREVIATNANISAAIESLKKDNQALIKHAGELQEDNRVMRLELNTMQSKVGVAREFVSTSLTSTDDSKSKELAVLESRRSLRHKVHQHHVFAELAHKDSPGATELSAHGEDDSSNDLSDDDSQDEDERDDTASNADESDDSAATSFLALSSQVQRRASSEEESFQSALAEIENAAPDMDLQSAAQKNANDPADLLDVLSKQVANLATQQKDSLKNLKALFIKNFRAGAKRHTALIVQQKALNATRTALTAERSKLRVADEHLESTRRKAQQRLRGLGLFLQKLSHLALAPASEAQRFMEALPSSVVLPAAPAKKA